MDKVILQDLHRPYRVFLQWLDEYRLPSFSHPNPILSLEKGCSGVILELSGLQDLDEDRLIELAYPYVSKAASAVANSHFDRFADGLDELLISLRAIAARTSAFLELERDLRELVVHPDPAYHLYLQLANGGDWNEEEVQMVLPHQSRFLQRAWLQVMPSSEG